MIIRNATLDDLESLVDLKCAFKKEHSRLMGGGAKGTREKIMVQLKDELETGSKGYMLAINDLDEVVAYRSWFKFNDFIFTDQMFVIPSARRSGIATQLVDEFEKWLQEQGQNMAVITVATANTKMMKFIKEQGYDIVNTIEFRKDLGTPPREAEGRISLQGIEWNYYRSEGDKISEKV